MEKLTQYIQEHILTRLREAYPKYKIEIGRGDRIMVDDKVIKGILFTPSRAKTYKKVEEHIQFVFGLIDEDIKRGRFIGLTND